MKDNILKFPISGTNQSFSIDFTDFDSEIMEKIFDVMNFLSNSDELIEKFTPSIQKMLLNEAHFNKTAFKKTFQLQLENEILKLIRNELVNHFNYTPEEIIILTDKEFVNLLTDGVYFDINSYKKGKINEHTN